MARSKLARVQWYVGQTLLPEHLEAQEGAADAALRIVASAAGLPCWGVSRLAWNATQLAAGMVSPRELTAVMRGGTIVDVPGNARLVAPLALDPKAQRAAIYLHVLDGTQDAERAPPYDDDPPAVERVLLHVALSTEAAMSRALDSMKLAELERDAHGGWTTAAGYVPALLQVSPSHPFREPLLGSCESLLAVLENQLGLRLSSTEHHGRASAAARQCLVEVQRVLSRLDDLGHGIHPHPYVLYAMLRDAYFAVCAYVEAVADRDVAPYRHDALATTFAGLAGELRLRLTSATSHLTERAFVRGDGLQVLAPLPEGLHAAREVYLLIRGAGPDARALVHSIKLAGRTRLGIIHRRVLPGIPIHHVGEPSSMHPPGSDAGCYRIGRNHEWELALGESCLAFHEPPGVDCRVSLSWR